MGGEGGGEDMGEGGGDMRDGREEVICGRRRHGGGRRRHGDGREEVICRSGSARGLKSIHSCLRM